MDDACYTVTYQDADDSYDEAQKAGDKADRFQMDVLFFAVALSLAAWASVVKEDSKIRRLLHFLADHRKI